MDKNLELESRIKSLWFKAEKCANAGEHLKCQDILWSTRKYEGKFFELNCDNVLPNFMFGKIHLELGISLHLFPEGRQIIPAGEIDENMYVVFGDGKMLPFELAIRSNYSLAAEYLDKMLRQCSDTHPLFIAFSIVADYLSEKDQFIESKLESIRTLDPPLFALLCAFLKHLEELLEQTDPVSDYEKERVYAIWRFFSFNNKPDDKVKDQYKFDQLKVHLEF